MLKARMKSPRNHLKINKNIKEKLLRKMMKLQIEANLRRIRKTMNQSLINPSKEMN